MVLSPTLLHDILPHQGRHPQVLLVKDFSALRVTEARLPQGLFVLFVGLLEGVVDDREIVAVKQSADLIDVLFNWFW